MAFKIGDRVARIHFTHPSYPAVAVGSTGKVTDVAYSIVTVFWDHLDGAHAAQNSINHAENLAHAPEMGQPVSAITFSSHIGATSGKPSNPKDRAATSRLDLSLFPQSAVIYGALAMTEGDCKYGGYNYRVAGVNMSVYVAALLRHVYKAYNGEWVDPVTKVPHFANAIACLAVLIDGYEQGNLKDDRPPVQDTAGLLKRSEEIVKHLQTLYPDGPERFTEKEKP